MNDQNKSEPDWEDAAKGWYAYEPIDDQWPQEEPKLDLSQYEPLPLKEAAQADIQPVEAVEAVQVNDNEVGIDGHTLNKMASHLRKASKLTLTTDEAKQRLLNEPELLEKYLNLKRW
jgi:hypothetical protein